MRMFEDSTNLNPSADVTYETSKQSINQTSSNRSSILKSQVGLKSSKLSFSGMAKKMSPKNEYPSA